MLDSDLAVLYGITTGNLNLAVRRNPKRFPADFMFRLTATEIDSLLLQNARAKTGRGGRRTAPAAFTELGVAMLSSVLKSERAVQMNILIMRAFVRMRELMAFNRDLPARVSHLECAQERSASVIEVLVGDIGRLAVVMQHLKALPDPKKGRMGFH